jgi:hypothetical protein
MADLAAQLAAGPEFYPMALDLGRDALLFIAMRAEDYRRESFLDERMLTPASRGHWVPFADVARAMSAPPRAWPLHFIFHSGHVGSTLLSRLLDETNRVLSLREPLPLRSAAEACDADMPDFDRRLEILLRLWERGFSGTEAVVLKATSTAERLGPRLLTRRPRAKAVVLNVTAETYLATMLAGENSAVDLNAHGPERFHRLGRFLVAPPRPAGLADLAAMSWLVERLTQDEMRTGFGERVLPLDFDVVLQDVESALGRTLAHLGLSVTPDEIAAVAGGTVLEQYSKAPQQGYSPNLRRERLAEARRLYGEEIRSALSWLERLGRNSPRVAAVL